MEGEFIGCGTVFPWGANPILLQKNRVSGEAEFWVRGNPNSAKLAFWSWDHISVPMQAQFLILLCASHVLEILAEHDLRSREEFALIEGTVNGPMYPYRYIIPPLPSRTNILFSL